MDMIIYAAKIQKKTMMQSVQFGSICYHNSFIWGNKEKRVFLHNKKIK